MSDERNGSVCLQALGVDGGQGWYFGRPAPADTLVDEGPGLAPPAAASLAG
ncbi:sensor c-di-GMP phosphodiesterase-like protein [Geodermatophilus bullaregiensis]|uniref:hypothetical protein n=1 Tax=Geodermatophilus bullaregiensis TaxID=1564160 RepID=UPI001957BE18|nr:hypothetical protein [Geodermatophilus bullaregiensis]MBM7806762.1 sensor c-di-GMP phosphodiesterase-like protein [Geodermatophilus bullaregiensis]